MTFKHAIVFYRTTMADTSGLSAEAVISAGAGDSSSQSPQNVPNLNLPGSQSFNRKSFTNELGLSQFYHYVGPDNVPELQAVHRDAYPTAIFYLATILGLYVFGLLVILIHYMNSSYGQWAWTLNDVWDELR